MIRLAYSDRPSAELLHTIREVVAGGGIVAYPTDTIYGLGGDYFSEAVHAAIDHLKSRPGTPYSAAVADLDMMRSMTAFLPAGWDRWFFHLFPGPYTGLFRPAASLASGLLKNSEKIALRIPDMPGLLRMIESCRFPWITTSVNRSGYPPLSDPMEIERLFPELDLLIDAGVLLSKQASTVVDFTGDQPRIVRPGMGMEKLKQVFPGIGGCSEMG